jgi:hypothetical protein
MEPIDKQRGSSERLIYGRQFIEHPDDVADRPRSPARSTSTMAEYNPLAFVQYHAIGDHHHGDVAEGHEMVTMRASSEFDDGVGVHHEHHVDQHHPHHHGGGHHQNHHPQHSSPMHRRRPLRLSTATATTSYQHAANVNSDKSDDYYDDSDIGVPLSTATPPATPSATERPGMTRSASVLAKIGASLLDVLAGPIDEVDENVDENEHGRVGDEVDGEVADEDDEDDDDNEEEDDAKDEEYKEIKRKHAKKNRKMKELVDAKDEVDAKEEDDEEKQNAKKRAEKDEELMPLIHAMNYKGYYGLLENSLSDDELAELGTQPSSKL